MNGVNIRTTNPYLLNQFADNATYAKVDDIISLLEAYANICRTTDARKEIRDAMAVPLELVIKDLSRLKR